MNLNVSNVQLMKWVVVSGELYGSYSGTEYHAVFANPLIGNWYCNGVPASSSNVCSGQGTCVFGMLS